MERCRVGWSFLFREIRWRSFRVDEGSRRHTQFWERTLTGALSRRWAQLWSIYSRFERSHVTDFPCNELTTTIEHNPDVKIIHLHLWGVS